MIVQWVVASVMARVIIANTEWYATRLAQPAWAAERWFRTVWRLGRACARGAYYVGIPYLALVAGLTPLRWYALADLGEGLRGLTVGLPLSAGFFVLGACLIWSHKELVLARAANAVFPMTTQRAQLSQPWGFSFIVWETLYLQAHWLFYRAGMIIWFDDVIIGTLGGAALVMLEWWLDLRVWQTARSHRSIEAHGIYGLLLILNGTLFVYTSNLWLMVCAHGMVWLGWLWLMERWYRPLALRATRTDEV